VVTVRQVLAHTAQFVVMIDLQATCKLVYDKTLAREYFLDLRRNMTILWYHTVAQPLWVLRVSDSPKNQVGGV